MVELSVVVVSLTQPNCERVEHQRHDHGTSSEDVKREREGAHEVGVDAVLDAENGPVRRLGPLGARRLHPGVERPRDAARELAGAGGGPLLGHAAHGPVEDGDLDLDDDEADDAEREERPRVRVRDV